jgi:hypothetical protein
MKHIMYIALWSTILFGFLSFSLLDTYPGSMELAVTPEKKAIIRAHIFDKYIHSIIPCSIAWPAIIYLAASKSRSEY